MGLREALAVELGFELAVWSPGYRPPSDAAVRSRPNPAPAPKSNKNVVFIHDHRPHNPAKALTKGIYLFVKTPRLATEFKLRLCAGAKSNQAAFVNTTCPYRSDRNWMGKANTKL